MSEMFSSVHRTDAINNIFTARGAGKAAAVNSGSVLDKENPMTDIRNVKQKEVGFAIHGLRAHIKALELSQGKSESKNEYRYEIASDRNSARVVRSEDQTEVEGTNRVLAEWASIGKEARAGLIGLKAEKDALRTKGEHVKYSLDVLTQEAYLSQNGQRLEGHPQSIADWAKKGYDVERKMFESLKAAVEYGIEDVEASVRQEMIRLGIFREPRTHTAEAKS
jgi:hypothetical protein